MVPLPPASPVLPVLTTNELRALFGFDRAAQRRYHVLGLVLHHHRTQRAAARDASISERTVRNLLRRFERQGLASLHTARLRHRRLSPARLQALQALIQARRISPHAGGDRLWRAAQTLLGPGIPLSRRTAYRMLAELRAQDVCLDGETAEVCSLKLLRAALPLLCLDPPVDLGHSTLAALLLPQVWPAQRRGQYLRQALRRAIDTLRPLGPENPADARCWPSLILHRLYVEGLPRADIEHQLAISPSTYSRAKQRGLRQLLRLLPVLLAEEGEVQPC